MPTFKKHILTDEAQPPSRRALAAQLVALHADEATKQKLSTAIQPYPEAFHVLKQEHAAHDAAAKMQQYGWTDVRQMRADLRDPRVAAEQRNAAARVLGDLRDRDSVGDLITALAEGDQNLAWACSSALNAIESRRHGRRLVRVLRKRGPALACQAAIYSIWMLREKRARATLIRIAENLDGEEEHTRSMATEALGNTVDRRDAQHALARLLFDPSVGVRFSALCALGGLQGVPEPIPEFVSRALRAKLDDPERLDDHRVIAELAARILNHGRK